MFTRISSMTLAILLFLVLFGSRGDYLLVVGAVAALIVATFAINFKRLNFSWPHLLLPSMFLVAVGSTYTLITNPTFSLIFLIASSLVFYTLEMKLGRESHFLQNIFLLSVFGWFLGGFAADFYFSLPALVVILFVSVTSYFFAVQGFAGFSLPVKKYFYYIIALVCGQTALALVFWPTYFFVNAVVVFSVFYLLWLFAFSAFFGKLSRAKIYLQTSLMLIILVIILFTTPWQPLR